MLCTPHLRRLTQSQSLFGGGFDSACGLEEEARSPNERLWLRRPAQPRELSWMESMRGASLLRPPCAQLPCCFCSLCEAEAAKRAAACVREPRSLHRAVGLKPTVVRFGRACRGACVPAPAGPHARDPARPTGTPGRRTVCWALAQTRGRLSSGRRPPASVLSSRACHRVPPEAGAPSRCRHHKCPRIRVSLACAPGMAGAPPAVCLPSGAARAVARPTALCVSGLQGKCVLAQVSGGMPFVEWLCALCSFLCALCDVLGALCFVPRVLCRVSVFMSQCVNASVCVCVLVCMCEHVSMRSSERSYACARVPACLRACVHACVCTDMCG